MNRRPGRISNGSIRSFARELSPERVGAAARARYRLAIYQAAACDYGLRMFIGNLRTRLNRPPLTEKEVPVGMVRDVVLTHYRVPEF